MARTSTDARLQVDFPYVDTFTSGGGPETKLKQRYYIEMCFLYPDEDKENRYMWCCEIVTRVKRRDNKMIMVDIKWEEPFFSC